MRAVPERLTDPLNKWPVYLLNTARISVVVIIVDYCKKLNSLKHLVRATMIK